MVEFLEPSLKTLPCTKSSSVSCESQSFLIISKCSHLYKKHCVFLCYFLKHDEVLLRSLLDCCYHLFYRSSQWLFKVKITYDRVSIKSKIRLGYVCLLQFLLSQFSTLTNLSAQLSMFSKSD